MAVEKVIFTNMCMVEDGAGNVLVQDRNDPGWPGVVFPGGHVEPGESFTRAVIREVFEETGLTIENPALCGVKDFYNETGARYVVLLYRARRYSGEVRSSKEGNVFWTPRETLTSYRLVTDFEPLLQVFEDETLSEFRYPHAPSEWDVELL